MSTTTTANNEDKCLLSHNKTVESGSYVTLKQVMDWVVDLYSMFSMFQSFGEDDYVESKLEMVYESFF